MKKNSTIFVAGHNGMVGSAIVRALKKSGFNNVITRNKSELNLLNSSQTEEFFANEQPEYIFLAAAKVGGILANDKYGGDFIRENILIQTNTVDAAYRYGAKKLLFLGSSCIYPRDTEQPIKEEALLTGELESTNMPYAIAKIAGKVMCDAYRKQFNFNAFTVMPSNVYGIGDNFDPENSHVIAGLMHRFHAAKKSKASRVVAWGSGSPLRELIYCEDLADACVFAMCNYEDGGLINAGSSLEYSIKEITEMIADITEFEGEIIWDKSKPDGTPRKIMDNTRLHDLGWSAETSLRDGLKKMYHWYLNNGSL